MFQTLDLSISVVFLLAFFPSNVAAGDPESALDFHVSLEGNDSWSGLIKNPNGNGTDGPFRSLERARDEIRSLENSGSLPRGEANVWIREGDYFREKTFELTSADSGTEDTTILYRSFPDEQVRFIGGKEITNWEPVTDPTILDRLPDSSRGKILRTDLEAAGITDFGKLTPRGFGRAGYPAHLELFWEDQPMQLARWPNEGWALIAEVPAGKQGGRFSYEGDRPERWTEAEDFWLHGLWTWDWADSYVSVETIEAASKEIVTREPHGVYGYTKGRRYYALNLLEELDQPGEWYLDRSSGILYFWTPSPIQEGRAFVSLLGTLVSMTETSHLVLQGLSLEVTRGTAVVMSGGHHNRISDCVVRNTGNGGVTVGGGHHNEVTGCEIYNTGDGGISLAGGDRMTLAPGNNAATDNHIHHFSRWCKTYRPAVGICGVGNRIAHNLIHDAPHNAIQLSGNAHLIEYNEVHHVCQETGDVGAFYMGRDWTQRENVVRYNFFHHIGGFTPEGDRFADAMSIYLDDWSSGTTVYGNICYKGGRAVLIGGGRDNTVENNIFVDCEPAVHVDSRGLGWAKYYFDGTTTTLVDRMEAVNYREPPYSERYPELLTLYDDEPALAKGNRIVRNISFGGRWIDLHTGLTEEIVEVKDNWIGEDPMFADVEGLDFRIDPTSPALAIGFKPIPIESIGLLDEAPGKRTLARKSSPEKWKLTGDEPRAVPGKRHSGRSVFDEKPCERILSCFIDLLCCDRRSSSGSGRGR